MPDYFRNDTFQASSIALFRIVSDLNNNDTAINWLNPFSGNKNLKLRAFFVFWRYIAKQIRFRDFIDIKGGKFSNNLLDFSFLDGHHSAFCAAIGKKVRRFLDINHDDVTIHRKIRRFFGNKDIRLFWINRDKTKSSLIPTKDAFYFDGLKRQFNPTFFIKLYGLFPF